MGERRLCGLVEAVGDSTDRAKRGQVQGGKFIRRRWYNPRGQVTGCCPEPGGSDLQPMRRANDGRTRR